MAIPDETDALGAALAALNRLVVDQESLDERLRRVAALTCTTISGCDMAAMTLLRDGRSSTDVCTDDTTKEIDAAQYASGSGRAWTPIGSKSHAASVPPAPTGVGPSSPVPPASTASGAPCRCPCSWVNGPSGR